MANLISKLGFAAAVISTATLASAQDVNWSWGIDFTSNYVFAGVTQSDDKPAIQPWFEVESRGFYFSFWGSTVDLGPDDWELDYYLGYRSTTGYDLNWDVSVARYTYDSTGYCCSEVRLDLSYPIADRGVIGGFLGVDPDTGDVHRYLDGSYNISNKITALGRYGASDSLGTEYWQLGASYVLSDRVSADLRYHGANVGDAGLVFNLSLGF
ncbi:TorF family putative porin [uncultured Shimia sp.]|uniref:TorF family putative porin n=1 Tax=uncultured Shimia sp. TaxID=573152 RepID=UPI0026128116|nr:TorF family putative porin [uncultured Shimia sp.]